MLLFHRRRRKMDESNDIVRSTKDRERDTQRARRTTKRKNLYQQHFMKKFVGNFFSIQRLQ